MIYEPYKPFSKLVILAGIIFILLIFFFIFAIIYSVRQPGAEMRRATAASARAAAGHINYDPGADVPPSYDTVERHPKRFSKPNVAIDIDRSTTETPPPSYELCSDYEEESYKF